jgi:hypothetical protein
MDLVRALWSLYEPIHAVTYFAPQARAAADAAGFHGFWMSYYAMRIAPLGAVGPDVATAAFYGFSPTRGRRALPDAWRLASPQQALRARLVGADEALQAAWADLGADTQIEEAAALAEEAVSAADTAGRVLAAANAALPVLDQPRLRLWQAATTLREHRGDGHNAALIAAGIGPIQAHLLKEAGGETESAVLRTGRDWPEQSWSAAEAGLSPRLIRSTRAGSRPSGSARDRSDHGAWPREQRDCPRSPRGRPRQRRRRGGALPQGGGRAVSDAGQGTGRLGLWAAVRPPTGDGTLALGSEYADAQPVLRQVHCIIGKAEGRRGGLRPRPSRAGTPPTARRRHTPIAAGVASLPDSAGAIALPAT